MLQELDNVELIAKNLNLPKDFVLKESLKIYVEQKLREIKIEIYEITKKYKISKIEEFEKLYEENIIDEQNSWKDFQKMDHLEFKKSELEKLLSLL
jgi:hypothetical protein